MRWRFRSLEEDAAPKRRTWSAKASGASGRVPSLRANRPLSGGTCVSGVIRSAGHGAAPPSDPRQAQPAGHRRQRRPASGARRPRQPDRRRSVPARMTASDAMARPKRRLVDRSCPQPPVRMTRERSLSRSSRCCGKDRRGGGPPLAMPRPASGHGTRPPCLAAGAADRAGQALPPRRPPPAGRITMSGMRASAAIPQSRPPPAASSWQKYPGGPGAGPRLPQVLRSVRPPPGAGRTMPV